MKKTTVELPEDLLTAARRRAIESGSSLRALVERALRRELAAGDEGSASRPRAIRWITVEGGIPDDLDISDRSAMSDWIRRRR